MAMRRITLILVLAPAVLVLFGPPAWAQRRGRESLAAQVSNWAQFRIVAGRITAESPYVGQTMSASNTVGDRTESARLSYADGHLEVVYELSTPAHQSLVTVRGDGTANLQRRPRGEAAEPFVEFSQDSGPRLTLVVGEGPDRRQIEGPTLWHVLLADPDLGRQRLIPLLALVQPDWDLDQALQLVEQGLLRAAASRRAPNRELWASLVAELGSDKYARRQAADRRLRAAGSGVVPFFRSLDPASHDAEQQLRIQRIVAALSGGDESDTPERVTEWLAWEPHVWYMLLARDEEDVRRAAAEQLAMLLDQPIDFEPAADAATRQGQMDRLRARVIPQPSAD
jgi:hypothetical protein